MANAWQLLIGGTDYSNYTDFGSWDLSASTRHRGSTLSGAITIGGKAITRPKGFQKITITNTNTNVVFFGGIVTAVTQTEENPTTYKYSITASDYTKWLDHIPVGASAYSGLVSDVFKTILQTYVTSTSTVALELGDPGPAAPLDLTGIQNISYTINSFTPNFIPVSQALDQLAKQVEGIWFIDPAGKVWFSLPDTAISAFLAPLNQATVTYFDQSLLSNDGTYRGLPGLVTATLPVLYADNVSGTSALDGVPAGQDAFTTFMNLSIKEDVSNVISGVTARNYMAASTSTVTEDNTNNKKMIGDGATKFFPLYNAPIDPAHTTVTVTPPGTVYSVANGNLKTEYVDGQPETPTSDDWCFVCTSNKGIRFNVIPANGATIQVVYNYYSMSQDVQKATLLAAEIANREGFGPGMYYEVLSDAGLSSPLTPREAIPSWQAAEYIMLNRYGRIKITATFDTYLLGFRPGQIFAIYSVNRGDTVDAASGYNIWGKTFVQRFFVTQVTQKIVGADGRVLTSVEAATDIWGE